MPRCFMAKKLKYPYEQWKQEQGERSASPLAMKKACKQEPREVEGAAAATAATEELRRLQDAGFVHSAISPSAFIKQEHPAEAHHHHLLAAHFGHYGPAFLSAAAAAAAAATSSIPHPSGLVAPVAHRPTASLTPPPEGSTHNTTGSSSGSPTKKGLFRPYCLDDPAPASHSPSKIERPIPTFYPYPSPYLQYRNIEDINTAHAILDLSRNSRSTSPQQQQQQQQVVSPKVESAPSPVAASSQSSAPSTPNTTISSSQASETVTPTPLLSPALSTASSADSAKTTAYTYEAFFASDGRSKKKEGEVPEAKARYTCSECGKHYATSSNLSRHKQTHRSLDSNNAKKCHVCGKCYVSMPALSMHILTHNLNHKCNVCGKAFSRPWLLQGHMRSHSGDKPYGCAHCGKSFADRSNLRAHMQTHSAFKNFKCKRCNKSFALKSYLNKHYESACFKDQPIPSIDTPPVTPAPSEIGSDGGLSPAGTTTSQGSLDLSSSSSTSSSSSSPQTISSLLSSLPPTLSSPSAINQHHPNQNHQLVRV